MALADTYDPRRVLAAIDEKYATALSNLTDLVVTVTAPSAADTQFKVKHGLTTQPVYWLVVWQDRAGTVYASGDKATDRTYAYLKSSSAVMKVKLLFFSL